MTELHPDHTDLPVQALIQCPMCVHAMQRVPDRDRYRCSSCMSEITGQLLRERALPDEYRVKLRRRPQVIELRGARITIEDIS